MNYTTNYHLPQWVESDRILMEDFNDAMESIEEGLTACTRSYHSVNTYGKANGETIFTFEKAPRFAILFSSGGSCTISSSGTCYLMANYSYDSSDGVNLRLSGTELILVSRSDPYAGSSLVIVAFY